MRYVPLGSTTVDIRYLLDYDEFEKQIKGGIGYEYNDNFNKCC